MNQQHLSVLIGSATGPTLQNPTITPKTFIEVFREFNHQDAFENDHSEKTFYKYGKFADNFQNFLSSIGRQDLLITELSMPILKSFVLWLPANLKSCCKTHISKHIHRINKANDYAVIMGMIPYNPTAAYRIKRSRNKEVVSLDDPEFLTWVNHKWHLSIYEKAQDNYIMQMTAGLSYMDLFNYKTLTDKKGLWIESKRGKPPYKPYYVPLWHEDFKLAMDIHMKYGGEMPFLENCFYNRLIKEMAAMLGIDKYLTTHVGRKTFATRLDDLSYPMPCIAAMLGNNEATARTHYVNSSKKKIESELLRRA